MKPIPTLNVNLKPCTCFRRLADQRPDDHTFPCGAGAVLIPCPIPRSVTFEVRLGQCACNAGLRGFRGQLAPHTASCPARPIRVTCSISGKTWEGSDVSECEVHHDGRETSPADMTRACRERWALVKALVLGVHPDFERGNYTGPTLPMFRQRDEVYAALADMARAEEAAQQAQVRAMTAFPWAKMKRDWDGDHIRNRRPSEDMLERYVEHLVEQVGILGVSP